MPMHLWEQRVIETGCTSMQQLRDRLLWWAERYGFSPQEGKNGCFAFRRGSHWKALYTFDLRKVPTLVMVWPESPEGDWVSCEISCGSWLPFAAPGDPKRLSEQMDLLEASLKAAIT